MDMTSDLDIFITLDPIIFLFYIAIPTYYCICILGIHQGYFFQGKIEGFTKKSDPTGENNSKLQYIFWKVDFAIEN